MFYLIEATKRLEQNEKVVYLAWLFVLLLVEAETVAATGGGTSGP
ncbi:hypothetical protein [Halorussus litoreus]|nr:hypothetical protein [Halorussus litoreus]